ncbi:MAG: ABC transporter substrate-binding protein [Syntrophomonadaceae bacterium]|jgi:NitT/TauT family transport system substrate-binding protein
MKRLSVWLALLLIGGLLATSMVGCGQKEESDQQLTKVRYCEVVRSIFYAPMYVAINEGFFAEEGLEIEMTTGQGADKVMTALLSGGADIGLAGPEATVYVYNQGQEDYVVNFAQLTNRDGSFLVGRQPEPDFKWENLRGKTVIGGRPGGVPEMMLEYVLKQHGLTPGQDVDIITNLQFTATTGAFIGGTGDYVANFEPNASQLEKEGYGYVVASLGVDGGEVAYTVFGARRSYLAENSEIVQRFTNAVYRGQLWVDQHSSEEVARSIQSFFPDTDLDLITMVVERYKEQDTWAKDPIMESKSLDRLQEIIKEAGELSEPVDSNLLITHEFAIRAMDEVQ